MSKRKLRYILYCTLQNKCILDVIPHTIQLSTSIYLVALRRSNLFLNSLAAFFSAALIFFMDDALRIDRSIGSSCSSSSLKRREEEKKMRVEQRSESVLVDMEV